MLNVFTIRTLASALLSSVVCLAPAQAGTEVRKPCVERQAPMPKNRADMRAELFRLSNGRPVGQWRKEQAELLAWKPKSNRVRDHNLPDGSSCPCAESAISGNQIVENFEECAAGGLEAGRKESKCFCECVLIPSLKAYIQSQARIIRKREEEVAVLQDRLLQHAGSTRNLLLEKVRN